MSFFAIAPRPYRGDGGGAGHMAWMHSPSGVGVVAEGPGPRPFSPHIATTGYDYDGHFGSIDVELSAGATIYAPMSGAIQRSSFTFRGFETTSQLDHFAETDPNSSLAVAWDASHGLSMTCSRVGAVSFPSGIALYQANDEWISPEADDFFIECQFDSAPSLTGEVGIGMFSPDGSQHVALGYNGTTLTVHGVGTATFTADGGTHSASSKTWLRIEYAVGTDTWTWRHGTTGTSWTTVATESGRAFTSTVPNHRPTIYWRSTDTNASPATVYIRQFNWSDLSQQAASRHGNPLTITGNTLKIVMFHHQELLVTHGDFVSVGQPIALCGHTGKDVTSGPVVTDHSHLEIHENTLNAYSRALAKNPLRAGYLPRANVSNNVSVQITSENDPDGVACHLMTVTQTRQDQDFDANRFILTGNTTTGTINFDARTLPDPDPDIPKGNGMYIVPTAFDENSSTLVTKIYFSKAVYGATLVSWSVADCSGTTLASG